MNQPLVDKLARALLYEGYMLYPYRASVKNSQRWTFGGVYPQAWSEAQSGNDPWIMQTECLLEGTDHSRVRVIVRFLQLTHRQAAELKTPVTEMPDQGEPEYNAVTSIDVDGESHQTWQEAEEREIDFGSIQIADVVRQSYRTFVQYPDRRQIEPLRAQSGQIVGLLIREQHAIEGSIEIFAAPVAENLFRLTVRISNQTNSDRINLRDDALLRSFISTHTILAAEDGQFVSLTDPPDHWKSLAAQCRNLGTWPVLAGEPDRRDTLLSSPIILGDYPQLAPESPGDLFDATEIDEILTLRILTLTDDEKRAAAGTDDRVRELLSRTESVARDRLMNLHGTIRGLRPVPQEQTHE
jgi:hypothetical protein